MFVYAETISSFVFFDVMGLKLSIEKRKVGGFIKGL